MVRRGKFRRSLIVTASVMLIALLGCKTFAQEKFKFSIGESSKTLSYGPLWVAAKTDFFEREGLDVPIITMRGSPLTHSSADRRFHLRCQRDRGYADQRL